MADRPDINDNTTEEFGSDGVVDSGGVDGLTGVAESDESLRTEGSDPMDGVPMPEDFEMGSDPVADGVPSPDAWDNAGGDGVPSPDAWDDAGGDGVPSPDAWDDFGGDGVPSPDEWDNAGDGWDDEESEYSEDDLTITNLYEKYTGSVEEALGDDRYFQYMFEMIQAGDNKLQQVNRVLHKVVDETWLTVVEEGIESIFKIVDKPRRFIATKEEVVPVALAKKISADSVRHLSQNTQFIATNAAGEMQPTKILNVTTEESYDLYENRFVYHLIQRLFAFVDKRTDVIFWATGDETCNVMSMESKVDDAYEQISYKVEMTVKNKQSLVENDTDNMSVFKRIDRVRRMSRVLRQSSFCEIMNGCAKVHSPIQRTNLMMKDPDYRACYKLWQFIESYDEVGFSIEEQDSAMEFDEEYLLQMYINMITNYTVFKSLLESDPRKMNEIAVEKKEPVKPKFIKEIKEEIVDDPNIPDVEIRKVFVEEVTQAQLDAEAALEKEKQHTQELEQTVSEMQFSMSDLQWQIDSLSEQLQQLSDLQAQTEEERNSYMMQFSEEQKAHQETKDAAEKAEADALAAFEAAQNEAQIAMETVQAEMKSRVEQVQAEMKSKVEQAQAEMKTAVEQAQAEKQAEVDEAKKNAEDMVSRVKAEAAGQIAEITQKSETELEVARKQAAEDIDRAHKIAAEEIAEAKLQVQSEIEQIRRNSSEEIEAVKAETEKQIADAKAEAEKLVSDKNSETERLIADIKAEAEKTVSDIKAESDREVAEAGKLRAEAERAAADFEQRMAEAQKRAENSEAEAAAAREQAANAQSSKAAAIQEAQAAVATARSEAETEVRAARSNASSDIEAMKKEMAETIARIQREASEQVAAAQKSAAEQIAEMQRKAAEQIETAQKREQKALAKAEANSLSHYIRRSLEERRERKNSADDK